MNDYEIIKAQVQALPLKEREFVESTKDKFCVMIEDPYHGFTWKDEYSINIFFTVEEAESVSEHLQSKNKDCKYGVYKLSKTA